MRSEARESLKEEQEITGEQLETSDIQSNGLNCGENVILEDNESCIIEDSDGLPIP